MKLKEVSCNDEKDCNDANKVESADAAGCGLGHVMNGKRKGENGKRLMHLRQRR